MENIRDISSGKMSPAPSPPTKEKISKQCLKPSSVLRNRPPRCLVLKREDGLMPTAMWVTAGQSHIEYLMLNGGAYPKEENESSLSQILQVGVPKKYYLSPRACQGILRRASARGKELPSVLKTALEKQAESKDLTDTSEA